MIGILNSRTIQSLSPKVMVGFCLRTGERGGVDRTSTFQLFVTLAVIATALLNPFQAAFALAALLALYWSRQVCMRALPADSFVYFGDTAVGKTAFPGA